MIFLALHHASLCLIIRAGNRDHSSDTVIIRNYWRALGTKPSVVLWDHVEGLTLHHLVFFWRGPDCWLMYDQHQSTSSLSSQIHRHISTLFRPSFKNPIAREKSTYLREVSLHSSLSFNCLWCLCLWLYVLFDCKHIKYLLLYFTSSLCCRIA